MSVGVLLHLRNSWKHVVLQLLAPACTPSLASRLHQHLHDKLIELFVYAQQREAWQDHSLLSLNFECGGWSMDAGLLLWQVIQDSCRRGQQYSCACLRALAARERHAASILGVECAEGMGACSGRTCLAREQREYQVCSPSCTPFWDSSLPGLHRKQTSCGLKAGSFCLTGLFLST